MDDLETKTGRGSWAIGGGVLAGIGVGFFFLQTSPLWFVGCILGGLGVGLILAAMMAR
jgi:hypothetical protein